ncbi:family 78 glycoside hydrolase catalytic domain [Bacteroidota bacterium]
MKYFFNLFFVASILFVSNSCDTNVGTDIHSYDLTCEYTINPLGIEVKSPRLSWKLKSELKGQEQTAYRILVSTTEKQLDNEKGDMWDSRKQESNQSVNISYAGLPLQSGTRYYWKVLVWDVNRNPGDYNEQSWFETGKFNPDDWQASWISSQKDSTSLSEVKPAPYFRKEFNINHKIKHARLYISGLGYYKSFINGIKTGNDELQPAFTRYDRRVKYNIYDVSNLITTGTNCLGVVLGNGWYNQHTRSAWDLDKATWRNWPTFISQLEITYEDGSIEYINSDKSWKFSTGPITFDGIRNGEHYDARLEIPGWHKAGYDDQSWISSYEVEGPAGRMSAQLMPPIRIVEEIRPLSIMNPSSDVYMLDFGRNIVGRLRISLKGEPEREIIMKYGERVDDRGLLDQKELARFIWTGDTQTDIYTCKGGEKESWESSFAYHGFQYVEIKGLKTIPIIEDFTGVVLNTDLKRTGSFYCSNELINKTHQNTLASFLGNYHGYPTDCPHREKIGWSGDAHLVAGVGCYNFDIATSYLKWMDDYLDEQKPDGNIPAIIPTSGWGYTHGRDKNPHGYGPHWDGAYILIPWELYLFTGDVNIIKKYYLGWKSYLGYLENSADDYILNYGIDDHKTIETDPPEPAYISTAHFVGLTKIMEKAAIILGQVDDKEHFHALCNNIYHAFNKKYYDADKLTYEKGSQAALAGALYFNLVPEERKDIILEKLVQKIEGDGFHIRGGVVGSKWIIGVLSMNDHNELLYNIVDNTEFPGWGHWVDRGATTLWQTWDGGMSLNHIMFGSIDEWFYSSLGGIKYDKENPGFQKPIINPSFVTGLSQVNSTYNGSYGNITSNWEINDSGLKWEIEIPVNTESKVYVPKSFGDDLFESGSPIESCENWKLTDESDKYRIFQVKSGHYMITVRKSNF